jgi:hypothetical protein
MPTRIREILFLWLAELVGGNTKLSESLDSCTVDVLDCATQVAYSYASALTTASINDDPKVPNFLGGLTKIGRRGFDVDNQK